MAVHFSAYPRLVARGTRWCLQHAWLTFAATLLLLVAASVVASNFEVDPSPEAYLRGSGAWSDFERIDRTFGIGETAVIALHEPGGTIFDVETVRAVSQLDTRLSTMPGVKRVLSIASASVLGNIGADGVDDVIDVGRLLPEGEVTPETASILGRRITGHKIYPRVLIDRRHETAFLLVQLDREDSNDFDRLEVVREIRRHADALRTKNRSIHMAGPPVTKEAIATGVGNDMVVFMQAALAVLLVLLWLMFGELLAAIIPVAVVAFASVFVVGILGAMGKPLNMATVMVPAIILVVGLADSVHLLAELRRQYARTQDREVSLVATVEAIALPCLLTSATSAAGFGALAFSRVIPLREFGVASAIGLMVAYVLSMFLTPVLLSAVRYPKAGSGQFVAAPKMAEVLTRLAVKTGSHALIPVATVGLLSGICFAATALLEVNSDFIGYFSPDHRLRRDMEVVGHTLGGTDTLEVIMRAPGKQAFLQPELLRKADEAATAIRQFDNVHGVLSFVDYLKLATSVLDPSTGFALPPTRNAVSQVLLLEAEGFPALISPDLQEIRMSLQVPAMPSASVRRLAEEIRQAALQPLEGTQIEVSVNGIPLLFAEVVRFVIEDAWASFLLVSAFIWLAMIVGLRSLSLATIAMIPNLLPIAMTFATMALLGISVDTNSAFVACLGLGIAVDDTVHIVARYQRARDQGAPHSVRALRYALTHAGHPVVLTSVLLVCGFGVLGLSSFEPTVRVGLLGALLIAYAGIFDLCVLPALLLGADRMGRAFEPRVLSRPSPITGMFESSHLTRPPTPASEDDDL